MGGEQRRQTEYSLVQSDLTEATALVTGRLRNNSRCMLSARDGIALQMLRG
jgi:hypothetical protein